MTLILETPLSVAPDPIPAAELQAAVDTLRADLHAVLPAIVAIVQGDHTVGVHAGVLADHLAAVVRLAAAAGLATIPHDPQGRLFDAALELAADDVTTLLALIDNAISGHRDHLADLTALVNGDRT